MPFLLGGWAPAFSWVALQWGLRWWLRSLKCKKFIETWRSVRPLKVPGRTRAKSQRILRLGWLGGGHKTERNDSRCGLSEFRDFSQPPSLQLSYLHTLCNYDGSQVVPWFVARSANFAETRRYTVTICYIPAILRFIAAYEGRAAFAYHCLFAIRVHWGLRTVSAPATELLGAVLRFLQHLLFERG